MSDVRTLRAPRPWTPWAISLGTCVLIAAGAAVERGLARWLLGAPAHLEEEAFTLLPRYLVWGVLAALVWLLARRFPLAGRASLPHAAVHLAGCGAYVALQTAAFTLADAAYSGGTAVPRLAVFCMTLLNYGPYDVGLYLSVLGVSHAVRYRREYVARAVKDAQLESRLAQADLDALRAHLQPAFLFRSLDAIALLMEEDVRRSRKALADLSELLRLSLNEGGGRPVPLGEEVELLERYFAVRALGNGSAVRLRLHVPDAERRLLVAPALLQPIANALLQGCEDGRHRPVMEVRAQRDGDTLRLEIDAPGSGGGVGSAAVAAAAARLERLYGGGASLRWQADDSRCLVRIDLPAAFPGARSGGVPA